MTSLLKTLFANRLNAHANVAVQLHVVLRFLHDHNLFAFLSQPSQQKAQTVWCAKLAQLAHSKSTSARFVAFALLTRTAATAQHGFLLARLALWLDLALAATSPDAEPVAHVRAMAALAAATLCARASRWSDSRRLVSLHHAAGANPTGRALAAVVNVLDLDVGLDDELFAYWSLALSVLLRAAPAAARALADRIERALLRALVAPHSAVKRRSAAACLALLPASASTRGAAASHADEVVTAHAASAIGDAYATLALRLVALAHDTLDVAFAAVVEPAESDALRVEPSAVGVGRALLGALPDESGAAADALALRFAALCDALSLLFRVEPPSDVPSRRRLPLRAVVALALRVLAVGAVITRNMRVRRGVNQLDGVPLLSRQDVGAALPSLHGAALTLLDALVQAVGTRMLSYADVVGDATLTALARSATPRASVAANAAMSIDAIAVGTGATDGAEFYNDEAAKAALLHAPTRPLAYALASRLLQLGGAGLEDRAFLAPLLAHATCDVKPLADDVVSASDGGAASSKKRKRAKQRGAAADGDAKTSSIEVSLRDLVSERARRAAMRVLHDALLHAPLALSNAVKRACAQAVIDVAARDMLAPQVQQSVATSENTVSALVSRARAEAASMRLIVVQTLDVVLRRVPAAAPASTELLRRLAQDPTEAVSMAARAALLREVHVESTIIKVAESAISVSTRANIEETAEDNDANDVADDNDDDDDDDDDAVEDDDDGVVQQVADDFVEHVEDEPEYSRKDEPAEEAPYEEPVNFEAVEPEDDVVAMATLTTTTTTTTTTVALTVDDADADEPILKRNRTEATAVVTRTYSANGDDDSDSISLPDIVVASPDEADLFVTHWVMAQPLELAQHTALMDVYDGLGCNSTVCARFSSSSACAGSMLMLTCVGGKVTRLSLYNYQLTGTISSTIGQLTALTVLSLSRNQISGTIPSTIGQLTALTDFHLSYNRLTGTIPSTIGQLAALTYLQLSYNQLIGTIPSTIGQLTALSYLRLENNQLTGSIPPLVAPLLICDLQISNDTNCLDCSMIPTRCRCEMSPCSMPTTTTTSTALPTTTKTAPPSSQSTSSLVTSSIDNVNTLSTSAVATTAISTASTSALTETTIGANQTLQESHASAITMPAAQSPEDNIALIGGVVGGAVALLLIGALIAFCVVRSRRNNKEQPYADPSAHALQSRSSSNYGRIDGISGTANNPAKSTYVDVVVGPPANYDAWSDPNDYADTGVADRNHYDDFTKIQ